MVKSFKFFDIDEGFELLDDRSLGGFEMINLDK